MTLKLTLSFVLIAAVAGPLTGCRKHEQAKTQTSSSAAAAKSPAPAASAAQKALTLDEFLAKLAPTSCDALSSCKNDKVKASVELMLTLMAEFGSVGKPALKRQVSAVVAAMKKDKAIFPNEKQCETIGSVALQVVGLTTDALKDKIGKTVKYDGDKAAACLAAIQAPFAPCATEFKMKKSPTLGDLHKISKDLRHDINAHTKVCNDVLVGTVVAGQPCEHSYECVGENSKCKKSLKHKKAKVCVNPKVKLAKAGAPAHAAQAGAHAHVAKASAHVHVVKASKLAHTAKKKK